MYTTSEEALRAIRARLVAREAELRDRICRVEAGLGLETAPQDCEATDDILRAVDDGARAELCQIERALKRLDVGTYEICEQCAEHIEPERLRFVPHADRCRRCAPDA